MNPKHKLDLYEQHLRQEHNLPADFLFFRWECFPHNHKETLYMELTGAVTPLKTRGKDVGSPNWKVRDRSTERTFVLTTDKQKELCRQYVAETGNCLRCFGSKQSCSSMSAEGAVYVTCRGCGGTGKEPA